MRVPTSELLKDAPWSIYYKPERDRMPKNNRICDNCKHWQESYNPNADTGICQLTHDCFTGRGYSCPEWKTKERQQVKSRFCHNCRYYFEPLCCGFYYPERYLEHPYNFCSNWQSKERQQMTVTKKSKCCADCDHWLIEDHSHFYKCKCRELRIDVTHDFCCNKWQAKEKPKSKNTTIGIDLELNGVSEFVEELDKVEKRVEKFAANLAHSLAAFNEMWNRPSLLDDD